MTGTQRPDTTTVDPMRVAEVARQHVQNLTDRVVLLEAQLADWQAYASELEKQISAGAD